MFLGLYLEVFMVERHPLAENIVRGNSRDSKRLAGHPEAYGRYSGAHKNKPTTRRMTGDVVVTNSLVAEVWVTIYYA